MPDGLTSGEQRYFQNLRLLYNQYRAGYITAEMGKSEKAKIKETFELDQLYGRAFKDSVAIRMQLDDLLLNSDCPVCQEVTKLLDGRQKVRECNGNKNI